MKMVILSLAAFIAYILPMEASMEKGCQLPIERQVHIGGAQAFAAQVDTYAMRVIPITARKEGYSGDEYACSGTE